MNSLNANLHFDLFGCPAASKPFYQERLKKLFNFSHSSDDEDNNYGDDHHDDDDDADDADDGVDGSHPDDGVELTHGNLLRPLHRCDHLLLVLERGGVDCNLDLYLKLHFAKRVTFAWILHPVGCQTFKCRDTTKSIGVHMVILA